MQKLHQDPRQYEVRHGKWINKCPSTPKVNADPTEVSQTYSVNINGTEVGHCLGKENILLQQEARAICIYIWLCTHHREKHATKTHASLHHKILEPRCLGKIQRHLGVRQCWMRMEEKYFARTVLLWFCFIFIPTQKSTLHTTNGQTAALHPYNIKGIKKRKRSKRGREQ